MKKLKGEGNFSSYFDNDDVILHIIAKVWIDSILAKKKYSCEEKYVISILLNKIVTKQTDKKSIFEFMN